MQILLTRLSTQLFMDFPYQIVGWVGWLLLLVAFSLALLHWRENFSLRKTSNWVLAGIFAVLALLTPLFIGAKLGNEIAVPLPSIPTERPLPALMVFSAFPWVLAAGLLGPLPAALVGIANGIMIGLVETHSIFTPLQIGGLALLFSAAVRQRYRTPFYQFLRHPFGAALVLALLYAPIFMISGFFDVPGSVAIRLDYAITRTWPTILARGGELLVAGLAAELLLLAKSRYWPRPAILLPSPAESSLSLRFFYTTVPLVLLLMLTLIVADWLVAGAAARQMVQDRLASTAKVAAESLPYFMEAGQNLIINMANPELLQLPRDEISGQLATRLRSVPYFRQLYLYDDQGNLLGGYPQETLAQNQTTDQEVAGLQLALKGVPIQSYVIPPAENETTAQVSFLALIQDDFGRTGGILLGRTDLNSNPFTQPAIQALEATRTEGGDGVIVDENKRIIYNADPALVMNEYHGTVPVAEGFFEDTSMQATRRFVYAIPVPGRSWVVLLSSPAQRYQQLALRIAIPLLAILLGISLVVFILLRLSLRAVTGSLHALGQEATRIASGELNHPLNASGEDEVGRLSTAFEKMRISLKARLEELNRLLVVSQGVASTLEIKDAVKPILEATLSDGASCARVALHKDVTLDPQEGKLFSFGVGSTSPQFAYLDEQIYEMMRHQESITIPNTARARRLNFPAGKPRPAALMVRALYHENTYYGAIWVAYDQPHAFLDEELRFFATLAGQVSLAAANARLYATAEVGRQRLEAVLSSTPEPVLVIDENSCLLLLNPAALQVTGLVSSSMPGKPIADIIQLPALREMLTAPAGERRPVQEISLANGRVYFVVISPVIAEGQLVGRICILQDITHYKELDTLKSEFVATVSHDLRSPLTLMRGYATMLQMVGDLNEQQKNYIRKINQGVENMTKLVNNLLDLGRIEAGIDLQLETVLVGEVIEQVVNGLQPQAAQKNISLAKDVPVEAINIQADPALLQQAFYNLVENAIKYTPVGGQVKVCLRARQNSIVFEVHDNGIGIAPLDLPHLFEKFFRSGRREAYQQRGTGLGLAIVKSIAERHNGRAFVDSTLGKGSTFYVEIPLTQPVPQEPD